jgi:hypothetical protein
LERQVGTGNRQEPQGNCLIKCNTLVNALDYFK